MNKILLVEDDMAITIGVEYALKKEGFSIKAAKNIKEAKESLKKEVFDLMLLDVLLPDGNGYDLCKEIREEDNNLPIIFMTACDEEVNVVLGLDIGGDDYIVKPVRIKELVSRINAILRRNKIIKKENVKKIRTGNILIEPLKFKIFRNGQEIILTSMEYKLLLLFVENKGNVLARNTILEKLWDVDGNFVDENTLNVYIKRLREKLEENLKEPEYIQTVRGLGYRWNKEVTRLE
ncbi:response regulator transcription factor [Clostridium hydrogenum]|uniref:response regulator transcription factor n=1 Tax=Clostridium hydrogenum TaxID=2855764 RepID=UPI001F45DE4C|nr:response regulator transcription factor [Clostridium hydrogenum]